MPPMQPLTHEKNRAEPSMLESVKHLAPTAAAQLVLLGQNYYFISQVPPESIADSPIQFSLLSSSLSSAGYLVHLFRNPIQSARVSLHTPAKLLAIQELIFGVSLLSGLFHDNTPEDTAQLVMMGQISSSFAILLNGLSE